MPALRTCAACGFENALTDTDCPLCGASSSEQPTLLADETTLFSGDRGRQAPGSLEGTVLSERFQVRSLLGRGGMGEVYRAHDSNSTSPDTAEVAIKVVQSLEDQTQEGRFRREIAALSRIHHPAVPAILDHGVHDGRPWYACELVCGRDLRFVVREDGPLSPQATAALGATVAEALSAAHAVGVIHRDVKPANIMLADDGSVKLLDFGLARGEGMDLAALTRTGMIVGTPSYMSPEQFEGRTVDARSDLYSLGIVLFEALTGRLPFQAPTPLAMALKHRNEPPPLPRVLRPEVPAWLERLILSCLKKDPAQRPATAAELAVDLRRVHAGPHRRRLDTGDWVIEDEPGSEAWTLVLATSSERPSWTPGMALRFEERYHKLVSSQPPSVTGGRFVYRFQAWPGGEVFRRLLDYDEDAASRGLRPAPKGP